MNDKVLELSNKIIGQVFRDMETSGDLQNTISKLITDIVQATVAYTINETLEFLREHPEVLNGD